MNQAAMLYNLQLLDTNISQVNHNIKQTEAVLRSNIKEDTAKYQLDEAVMKLEKSTRELKLLEDKAVNLQVKIDQSSSSLYGGSVRNPKELQDLQKELQSLRNRMASLEEHQLEQMLQVDADQTEVDEKKHLYNNTLAEETSRKASLRGEIDRLRKNLEKLNVERQAVSASISPVSLKIYRSLLENKRGIAVAKNIDSSCSACGAQLRPAEIQAARSSNELTICGSCGRIIFSE